MKKQFILVLMASIASTCFSVLAPATASAAGCAQLVRTYDDGRANRYAEIKNICSHPISARAVVNLWGDSGCFPLAPGQSLGVRTGGIGSPKADDAVVC